MQKPKPRYAAEINDGIWGVRREYVYLCHEMDPYIEQLEKRLEALTPKPDQITDRELWGTMMNLFQWAIELSDHALHVAGLNVENVYRKHFGSEQPSGKIAARLAAPVVTPKPEDEPPRASASFLASLAPGPRIIAGDAPCQNCGHLFRSHNGDRCHGGTVVRCSCRLFLVSVEDVTDGE